MGKYKMAKLRKSGMCICLATVILCISLFGQVQAAGASSAGAAGTGSMQDPNAGMAQPGDAGMMQPGDGGMVQSGDAGMVQPDHGGMAQQPGNSGMVQPDDAGMAQAADVRNVRPEAGIIEVQSGFVDLKGKFWKMKSGSGFLIANKESDTYIVTNSSSVSNTPNKIKKFCKKNEINTENMQFTNTIRVVITGDVTAEAEVVMKSAEKDYCVLSAENVVSQKESLKIGDSSRIAVNDLVYAYGFPEQTDTEEGTMEYSEMDVRSMQGAVLQTDAYLDSGVYLAHSAPVMQGLAGGPLLDADGYVIGLNCRQSPEDDTGVAYALPINEISAVLDNFSIYYGSRAIDEAYMQLRAAYQECAGIQAAGGYKKASMEALEQALGTAQEMMNQEEPSAQELLNTVQMLFSARDALVPKTETLTIVILVLAVLDLILFIWMLILAVKNAGEKKRELQRIQPAMQGAGYAGAVQNAGSRQQSPRNAGYAGAGQRVPQNAGQQAGYTGAQNAGGRNAGYAGAQNAGGGNAGYAGAQNPGMQRQQMLQNQESLRRPVAPPAGRRLHMLRQKTGQTIVLNKNQFIIGKSQSLADFCIADNQTISRKHAMLYEDNGGWYVDDLNSLNGTCVNGQKVVPGQAVRLKSGDEISLSDETFLVQD